MGPIDIDLLPDCNARLKAGQWISLAPIFEDYSKLYALFSELIAFVEEDNNLCEVAAIDDAIAKTTAERDSSGLALVQLQQMYQAVGPYQSHGHQYFSGTLGTVLSRTRVPEFLKDFWQILEAVKSACDARCADTLGGGIFRSANSMIKVWRYRDHGDAPYLAPPHYDRAFFSVLVNSLNPDGEQFRIGCEGAGLPIDEIGRNYANLASLNPRPEDLPLLFAGTHARTLGYPPVWHSVDRMPIQCECGTRYSLIYFVTPKGSAQFGEQHIHGL